jgi:DNA repair photolyase
MLSPFFGEFLISPCPLELSLNYCSHSCYVCFANLNLPSRQADVPRIMRFLGDYPNRSTWEARLLQMGHTTVVSNHVDPFANSNYQQAVPIMEFMTELGLPIQLQTRGGRGVEDTLRYLKPSIWYISMSHLDDSLRKKVEPGSTTIESRFQLMDRLRTFGHRVVLGLNPLVPEWLPDAGPLLKRAQQCGAEAVWIEKLHLNYNQERNMSLKAKEAVTPQVITRAKRRSISQLELASALKARSQALDLGLPVYSMGQPYRSDFHKVYQETYTELFPTMQDFINYCYDENLVGQLITFDEFADFFCARLPTGIWPIDGYIGSTSHNLWWDKKIAPNMTFRELFHILWTAPSSRLCPVKWNCFAYAAQWDKDGWIRYADANGMPYIIFDPKGFTEYCAHVELNARFITEEELVRLLETEIDNG